jgi:hypothetical protein
MSDSSKPQGARKLSGEQTLNEYRIVSSYPHGLPFRFKGRFTYAEAYQMCCDWNSWHLAQDMAFPEKVDERAGYMEDA